MKNVYWLSLKLDNFATLGCVWISVVQCTVLNSCLKSCVTNLVSFPGLIFVFIGSRRDRIQLIILVELFSLYEKFSHEK